MSHSLFREKFNQALIEQDAMRLPLLPPSHGLKLNKTHGPAKQRAAAVLTANGLTHAIPDYCLSVAKAFTGQARRRSEKLRGLGANRGPTNRTSG